MLVVLNNWPGGRYLHGAVVPPSLEIFLAMVSLRAACYSLGKGEIWGKSVIRRLIFFIKVPLGWHGNIVLYSLQKVLKSHVLLRQMTPGNNSVFHYESRRKFACTCHCIWRERLVICSCGLWFLMKTWFSGFRNVLEIIQILLGFQKQLICGFTWCTFTWWLRRSKVNQLCLQTWKLGRI